MARAVRRPAPALIAWLCRGVATCFGSTTVTLGSDVEGPAVCDTAALPGKHSIVVDKRTTAAGATRPDDNLMTRSLHPDRGGLLLLRCTLACTLPRIVNVGHGQRAVYLRPRRAKQKHGLIPGMNPRPCS